VFELYIFDLIFRYPSYFFFTGTNGWLVNFLSRHNLTLRRITSSGRALPKNSQEIIQKHLKKMAQFATEYRKSSILNMDETNIQLDYPCKYKKHH